MGECWLIEKQVLCYEGFQFNNFAKIIEKLSCIKVY